MCDNDRKNLKIYSDNIWVDLTIDEAKEKVNKLFGNEVRCIFVDKYRITEEYYLNYITFLKVDNKIIGSRWG